MPFQMPDVLSKNLAVSTIKVYTTFLNRLAGAGYDTPDSLRDNAAAVAKWIGDTEPGDDNGSRQKRRYFISAVFAVLPEAYRKTTNPYLKLSDASLPKGIMKDGVVTDFVRKFKVKSKK